MTTKIELIDGPGFELYQEVLDPEAVYLRLHNTPEIFHDLEAPSFEVQANSLGTDLRLRIPTEIFKQMRLAVLKDLSNFEIEDQNEQI